jgi:3'(2'), 5'-bisphosphate nucleotidase
VKEDAAFARRICAEAAVVVRSMQGNLTVRDKGGALGPVTDADLAANRMLVEAIRARHPEDAILSEESEHDFDPDAERIWCVDPVDGTREFAKGLDEWAVMVGLLQRREPVLGAVALYDGRVFWGWRGGGAFERDRAIAMPGADSLEGAVAIHSRSHREGNLQALDRLGIRDSVTAGSVGYKVAQLLSGQVQVYVHWRGGTAWWDSVAPAAVTLAAGGYVGNARGGPLRYGGEIHHPNGLLFAAPGIGAQAAARLADGA